MSKLGKYVLFYLSLQKCHTVRQKEMHKYFVKSTVVVELLNSFIDLYFERVLSYLDDVYQH